MANLIAKLDAELKNEIISSRRHPELPIGLSKMTEDQFDSADVLFRTTWTSSMGMNSPRSLKLHFENTEDSCENQEAQPQSWFDRD